MHGDASTHETAVSSWGSLVKYTMAARYSEKRVVRSEDFATVGLSRAVGRTVGQDGVWGILF